MRYDWNTIRLKPAEYTPNPIALCAVCRTSVSQGLDTFTHPSLMPATYFYFLFWCNSVYIQLFLEDVSGFCHLQNFALLTGPQVLPSQPTQCTLNASMRTLPPCQTATGPSSSGISETMEEESQLCIFS